MDFLSLEHLQLIWFMGICVLFAGYAMLDGFDLGVGMLHLFTKGDLERRLMLNSIGPVWDGNEVWLVTAAGALFATFPPVYASFCSGFYGVVMLLLCALIFRAVAIEFRSKKPMAWWRTAWDVVFALGSFLITILLGVVIGNLIGGLPLNAEHEYEGSFLSLFNPYALSVALMMMALFCMHGAIYVVMKMEGEFHDKIRNWIKRCIGLFITAYGICTIATLIYMPHMVVAFREHPGLFGVAFVAICAIANIPREINHGCDGRAFISSCVAMAGLMSLFALGMFPYWLRATNDLALSLTVYNSSSSVLTLHIVFVIALIGVPLVLGYTTVIYWLFRGKVRLDASSY